jgi:hypothetical protein
MVAGYDDPSALGSAFAANANVLLQAFRWLSGQDHVVRFDFPLPRSFSISFCRGVARRFRMPRVTVERSLKKLD